MEGTYRRRSEDDNLYHGQQTEVENGLVSPSVNIVSPKSASGSVGIDLDEAPASGIPEDNTESDGKGKKKKSEEAEKPPAVSFGQLFRYATRFDVLLIIFGTFGAIGHGAATPLQFIIFGELINSFIDFAKEQALTNGTATYDLEGELTTLAIYYIYLAVATLLIGYLQMGFWSWTGSRQTKKMRIAFFRSILKQDIGWFDTTESGELNNRLTEDLNKVSDGIGHKIALFLQSITMVFAGFGMGFAYGWKLTLVILALSPLIAIAGGILGKIFSAFTTRELDAYAKAGSIAEEVISSIRTVAAFGGEKKEYERYSSHLFEARDLGIRKALSAGLGFGFFQLVMFGSYAMAFWYGSKLIIDGEMTGGSLLIVFFSVMVGAMQLGQAGPQFEAIATAKGAAYQVFKVIDRVPPFDSSSTEGEKPEAVIGDIEFKDIHFNYPSRPDVKILNGLNLSISSGQTVALVGESGCGKSTLVKLIQRFYDPSEGQVTIDGKSIPSLNVKWLRQHIGVVSQEPALFATTIAENIRYGKDGVTQQEIEDACKMANAHDFVSRLPQKYDTLVGERGTQLSGGQKQRIAIARALVKDPKILLLDEATSALDTESESVVQAALDKARLGRTTIIIAHRLSTVRNADVIAAIEDGVVVEKGAHAELMEREGVYRQLVTLQTFEDTKHDDDEDDEEDDSNGENKESRAAIKFMRTISTLSSDSEPGEGTGLERKLSARLSKKMSFNRPHSAMERHTEEKKKNAKDEVEEEDVEPAPIKRILKMNQTEWPLFVGGSFGAVINGLFPMVFALLLGEILETFTLTDFDEMKERSLFWALMFLALGAATCFAQIIQNYMFGKSGEIMTLRLRKLAFESILKQEMSFFDDPVHSTGALTTALATHASDVKGATGSRLGNVVMSLSTAIACIVYAFYNGWMLTLVVLGFLPFLMLASGMQMKGFTGGTHTKDNLLESGAVSVEAIENIRTVISLGIEQKFYEKYVQTLVVPHNLAVRRAHLFGISFGLSEAIMFCCNAAAFRFGGYLVVKGDMDLNEVMKVIFSIVIGAMVLGQVNAMSPDYVKAKIAAARLFKIFDRVSAIDSSSDNGLTPSSVQGSIQLRSVRFRYPTRQDVKVLRGLTLSVKPGQKLALVGSSGCGKSTVISLLERFYDVTEGEVSVDGSNVRSLNIKWLRSRMGIVSQEPVLFGCSIAENIAYGDNSRDVSMEEIENAAKAANIHSFINTLPKGYDTLVGDKGTLISGGQKQRIAIARALIRNPRILLLDEATSALDTDSEKVVQEALDAASEGRTTIVIAHRLSTVQNADVIAVIDHGRVVEQGTHQELLALKGTYYSLVTVQIQAGGNGDK